jgi:hypothetical protein
MEVYRKDLAKMSREERNRTLGEMVRVATAHRDRESRFMHIVHAVQAFFMPGRVPR